VTESPAASLLTALGIRVGDLVAEKYRVEHAVGRGGMGIVVAARHVELDERVAVKFLVPEALSDPEAVSRFEREVRAEFRLKSEYVARVHDAGRLPNGNPYKVLEYLEGEDLAARVAREGPLPIAAAVRFVLQASLAVAEAHALGIIHRDLKPANLFVVTRRDGVETVKVLDFGVLKRMPESGHGTEPHMTRPGSLVGTPLYMSPEQLQSAADVDARTDVWSLGATLFELLSGRPPFQGNGYAQVITSVLDAAPPPLRSLRPEVSLELEQVVTRCLEKQPESRYDSVAELALALGAAVPLDSELEGLLERIVRQRRGLPPARASEPGAEDRESGATPKPLAARAKAERLGDPRAWRTTVPAAKESSASTPAALSATGRPDASMKPLGPAVAVATLAVAAAVALGVAMWPDREDPTRPAVASSPEPASQATPQTPAQSQQARPSRNAMSDSSSAVASAEAEPTRASAQPPARRELAAEPDRAQGPAQRGGEPTTPRARIERPAAGAARTAAKTDDAAGDTGRAAATENREPPVGSRKTRKEHSLMEWQ
jgi:serine/threonine protein kinase